MRAVSKKMKATVRRQLGGKPPFPLAPIDHVEVPCQHVHTELLSPRQEMVEKLAQAIRELVGLAVGKHADSAVEIPSEDQDAMACVHRRLTEGGKIRRAVDEEGHPVGLFDFPTVATDIEPRVGQPERRNGLKPVLRAARVVGL